MYELTLLGAAAAIITVRRRHRGRTLWRTEPMSQEEKHESDCTRLTSFTAKSHLR